MYTISSSFYHLKNSLITLYDEREAAAIAHEILGHITGLTKTERLIEKDKALDEKKLEEYEKALAQLAKGVPLQYVTGVAWFMGFQFIVSRHVLIPRPETEELVQWIVDDCKNKPGVSIIDIGTGSGCIPISLKKLLPAATVTSGDVSPEAIDVARKNAAALSADIEIVLLNFLDYYTHNRLGNYDIIVSNPPYIPQSEKEKLHVNVRDNEPSLALFVADNDPLIFYRALAIFGKGHLKDNGYIYCELDADNAQKTKILFENEGYKNVELKKDIHGNERMLRASRT